MAPCGCLIVGLLHDSPWGSSLALSMELWPTWALGPTVRRTVPRGTEGRSQVGRIPLYPRSLIDSFEKPALCWFCPGHCWAADCFQVTRNVLIHLPFHFWFHIYFLSVIFFLNVPFSILFSYFVDTMFFHPLNILSRLLTSSPFFQIPFFPLCLFWP